MSFRQVNRYKSADDLARESAGGDGVTPTAVTGLVSLGAGRWAFDDSLTTAPDAFMRTYDSGTTYVIDPGVGDGLALAITAGNPEITAP